MKTDFSGLNNPVPSDSSSEPGPSIAQISSKKRFSKKIYAAIGAIIIIAIIAVAVLLVPIGTADTIPLGVNYTVGETLVYAVTTTDQIGSNFTNLTGETQGQLSFNSTISIYVVSLDQETYTLNYTATSTILGTTFSSSELQQVNKTDMASFVALMPIELQTNANSAANIPNNPFLLSFFNQADAKVGDTWTLYSNSGVGNLVITLRAIQNLVVPAGTYKVFKIDYSTSGNPNSNNALSISGTSYLEYGTCKQIQSTLQVIISTSPSAYLTGYTIDTTLVQQTEP